MTLNKDRARQWLAKSDLRNLFIDELGWDQHNATLEVPFKDATQRLHALAQKRGMVAWQCPAPAGQPLPDYAQRRKIEYQVAKSAHEHLIVFTDAANDTQVWQWVKREPGKPAACREHPFHRTQPGDALLQKLEAIAFTLEEEERLSLTDITGRARAGFDVERVTKRFYDRFQKEHTAFLTFISGITERADHEWYASVMLNRLMFVYFIQRKGFLDGDRDYLRNRLNRMRAAHGKDKFYSFYCYFLLRLFHEGLGGRTRSAELEQLVGRIPYLNGGLFDVHELERPDRYGKTIQIPDQAFERIFDYFDQYQWHLDERPLRADNEINPDVLGYIFEKYINQQQMGAYYTKEDITEYISKNTVLPFLFDAARAKCKVAFENPKGPTVWDLLRDDPDRYIYPAVRHSITWDIHNNVGARHAVPLPAVPLPDDIAAGLNPPTLHEPVGEVASVDDIETIRLRKNWNKPAPPTHALPTETWREVIARRKRYEEIKAKLAAGEVRDINDLITLNLDIRQFAQDAIENCEGPELLRAFWHAIEKVTILDPTCGSGAFLFAVLNILEPLYEACLDRMEAFVADLERSGEKHRPEKFSDFRKVLANVAAHPNRRYFIFKSIILNNLYGVDIMEEAVEICKLRLFLKLAAQVEPDPGKPNQGIEPLPDIDFNIKAGNTLVGFASMDEVRQAVAGDWIKEAQLPDIEMKAADLQQAFDAFRARQVEGDGSVPTEDKQELRKRLSALDEELNRYLASEYGVEPSKKEAYGKWLKSHQPFHWFVEFYGIVSTGGFDVIIGNPPYIEYVKIKAGYRVMESAYSCLPCGNLYAFVIERCFRLGRNGSRLGMIVQLSAICTDRMEQLQIAYQRHCDTVWASCYDDRPGKLFDGLEHIRATILLSHQAQSRRAEIWTTNLVRWYSEFRNGLFPLLSYGTVSQLCIPGSFPKIGEMTLENIVQKIRRTAKTIEWAHRLSSPNAVYYYRSPLYWIRSMDFLPHFDSGAATRSVHHFKDFGLTDKRYAPVVGCLINSTIFYIWFIAYGNGRNVALRDIVTFPAPASLFEDSNLTEFRSLFSRLMVDYCKHSVIRRHNDGVEFQEFYPSKSKPILDEIDTVLARHYSFTEEELDFIINYDIKYRMGREAEDGEE